MYKCNNCGLEFETLMQGIGHLSGYGFCPRCQDSDFEVMKKCEIYFFFKYFFTLAFVLELTLSLNITKANANE